MRSGRTVTGLYLHQLVTVSSLSADGYCLGRSCISRGIGPVEQDNVGICSEIPERQS